MIGKSGHVATIQLEKRNKSILICTIISLPKVFGEIRTTNRWKRIIFLACTYQFTQDSFWALQATFFNAWTARFGGFLFWASKIDSTIHVPVTIDIHYHCILGQIINQIRFNHAVQNSHQIYACSRVELQDPLFDNFVCCILYWTMANWFCKISGDTYEFLTTLN